MPDWAHFEAAALAPVVPGLRALEAGIRYPIDDGAEHFTIDHGTDYAAFYRGLGEAHYLVARDEDLVVGVIAGALRDVDVGGRSVSSVYLGDLKVAPAYRGTGLARSLAVGCVRMMRQRRFRRWRLVYFAAMRGDAGDVSRTLRGLNPGRLLKPLARLQLFFVDRATLMNVDATSAPPSPTRLGVDLSTQIATDLVSTAGRKDLQLASTGAPWPLVHLARSPAAWGPSLGAYLRRCAGQIARGSTACFALDERLTDQVEWLRAQSIAPGAVCTVHGLAWPGVRRRVRRLPWVHLATSEI